METPSQAALTEGDTPLYEPETIEQTQKIEEPIILEIDTEPKEYLILEQTGESNINFMTMEEEKNKKISQTEVTDAEEVQIAEHLETIILKQDDEITELEEKPNEKEQIQESFKPKAETDMQVESEISEVKDFRDSSGQTEQAPEEITERVHLTENKYIINPHLDENLTFDTNSVRDFIIEVPPPTPENEFKEEEEEEEKLETCFMDYLQPEEEEEAAAAAYSKNKLLQAVLEHETSEIFDEEKRKKKNVSIVKGKKTGFKDTRDSVQQPTKAEIEEHKRQLMLKHKEDELKRTECTRYAGAENFASNFVDAVIDKSVALAGVRGNFLSPEEETETLTSTQTYVEVFGTFTRWPRIEEFNKEVGKITISDYMSTWSYEEEWLYCVDFLMAQSDECSDYFQYEAKWSIPTTRYPIPQATASIFFTVEVSRIKPTYCPVDVTYTFEGSRLIHIPGKIPFQEQWLFSIVDSKLKLFQNITF